MWEAVASRSETDLADGTGYRPIPIGTWRRYTTQDTRRPYHRVVVKPRGSQLAHRGIEAALLHSKKTGARHSLRSLRLSVGDDQVGFSTRTLHGPTHLRELNASPSRWRPVSSSRRCRACRPPAVGVVACVRSRCFARRSGPSSSVPAPGGGGGTVSTGARSCDRPAVRGRWTGDGPDSERGSGTAAKDLPSRVMSTAARSPATPSSCRRRSQPDATASKMGVCSAPSPAGRDRAVGSASASGARPARGPIGQVTVAGRSARGATLPHSCGDLASHVQVLAPSWGHPPGVVPSRHSHMSFPIHPAVVHATRTPIVRTPPSTPNHKPRDDLEARRVARRAAHGAGRGTV